MSTTWRSVGPALAETDVLVALMTQRADELAGAAGVFATLVGQRQQRDGLVDQDHVDAPTDPEPGC